MLFAYPIVATIHTLALHAKLHQTLQINSERHLLLFVMDLCKRLYRYCLLLLTAGVHKNLQNGILIWVLFNRLLSCKCSNNELNMFFFFLIFPEIDSNETGR